MSDVQPAGWYPAEGDPPGTQRYWDGTQWQGGPQPIGGAPMGVASGAGSVGVPAEFGSRVIAYLIDWGILAVAMIAVVIVGGILGAVSDVLGALVIGLGYLGAFVFSIWNYFIRQGQTGQSLGKQQQGIKLVSDKTGAPIGIGMSIVRYLVASAISFITCGLGGIADLLWPLFDKDKKRLTDKVLDFSVINV